MIKAIIHVRDFPSMSFNLDETAAPISVANFVKLAEDGYYTGLVFHRIIPGFMIQGGGMDENLREKGKAKKIKGEFKSNGVNNSLRHVAGTISMARTMIPDSATSQFFVCVAATPHLDGEYAAFGQAADEETVATAIAISRRPTKNAYPYQNVPVTPIVIDKVEIIK